MSESAAALPELARETLVGALATMLRARRFEEAAAGLYGLGLIPGDLQLSIGQEAATVGLRLALSGADAMAVGPRCLGHAVAAGVEMADLSAALVARGPQAPAAGFVVDRALGFSGGAPEAGPAALALGLALAHKARGAAAIGVGVIDDLAAARGETAEALRLAKALRAPLLLVVEDARVADPAGRLHDALRLAGALDIPAEAVEATTPDAVVAAVGRSRRLCLARQGPVVLVLRTLRHRGHSLRDPAARRRRGEERRPGRGEDPIAATMARLAALGVEAERIEALEEAAQAQAEEAAGAVAAEARA